jgi:S-adenosylmethionine synthetase
MQLTVGRFHPSNDIEVVERKGSGHPDTLSDELAEAFSRRYANYTTEHFGAVLHHNFDKVGLLGGRARVTFGSGELVAPIRVLVNGRASHAFGGTEIPVLDLLHDEARAVFARRLPSIDPQRGLLFLDQLSTGPSPGQVDVSRPAAQEGDRRHWFAPRSIADLRETSRLSANDTSAGAAHYPLTQTEQVVLAVEEALAAHAHHEFPWLGTDIKIMACRRGARLGLTLCIPQIANHTHSLDEYRDQLATARKLVERIVEARLPSVDTELSTNTRDDYTRPELYLTATGSSIESGDEGLVGRGNRPNGLISMSQPYSMEGACGKNPVYHAGKIYPLAARRIARALHEQTGAAIRVWIVGQSGRLLADPWQVVVEADDATPLDLQKVDEAVRAVLDNTADITKALLCADERLY